MSTTTDRQRGQAEDRFQRLRDASVYHLVTWLVALLLVVEGLGALQQFTQTEMRGAETLFALRGLLALGAALSCLWRKRWTLYAYVAWWLTVVSSFVTAAAGRPWHDPWLGVGQELQLDLMSFVSGYLERLSGRGLLGSFPMLVAILVGGCILLRPGFAPSRESLRAFRWAHRNEILMTIIAMLLVIIPAVLRSSAALPIAVLLAFLLLVVVVPLRILRFQPPPPMLPMRRWGWLGAALSVAWLFAGAILRRLPPVFDREFGWLLLLAASAATYVIELGQLKAAWQSGATGRALLSVLASIVGLLLLAICLAWVLG